MPYVTQLNGALVGTEADVLVVEIPATTVLNDFGTSEEFGRYDVADDADGAETVNQGDFVAPVVGGTPMPGTYPGSGSLSTAVSRWECRMTTRFSAIPGLPFS